jgi:hypothetical protein
MRVKIWLQALISSALVWFSTVMVLAQSGKYRLSIVENLRVSNLKATRIVIAWEYIDSAEQFHIYVQSFSSNFTAMV